MSAQERWYRQNLDLENQVVADVGAQVGRLSAFFWRAGGGTSQVVSFEPLAENRVQIEARIQRLGASGWRVVPAAVSDTRGTAWVRTQVEADGAHNCTVTQGPGDREVPTVRLHEALPDATVVKLDIEGHEHAVLADALPRLPGVRAWAVEIHLHPDHALGDTIAAFEAHGYGVVAAVSRRGDTSGQWVNLPVRPSLSWDQIPVAQRRPDGSVFKMLHVLARR